MSSDFKKSKFDIFIEKKYYTFNKNTKIGVFVAALVVPGLLFYFLLLSPQTEQIASLDKKISVAEEELKKTRKAARDLPKHKKEFEEIEQEFEAMAVLLPKTQEIPNLLRNISDLGKSSGLDFLSFVPGAEIPKDFYAEIPVDIRIKGPYHNVGTFLDKVSKLERIVTVNNIKIEKPEQEGSEIILNSSCRLLTYRFTNKPLAPDKNAKQKKK